MKRALPWALAVLVVLLGALAWAWYARRPADLTGGIVLRSLQCDGAGGAATVSARAENQTNQRLIGVVVEYVAGAGPKRATVRETLNEFEIGGQVNLHHALALTGEIDACSVKFYRDGTQLPTAFKP